METPNAEGDLAVIARVVENPSSGRDLKYGEAHFIGASTDLVRTPMVLANRGLVNPRGFGPRWFGSRWVGPRWAALGRSALGRSALGRSALGRSALGRPALGRSPLTISPTVHPASATKPGLVSRWYGMITAACSRAIPRARSHVPSSTSRASRKTDRPLWPKTLRAAITSVAGSPTPTLPK